jgi:hypothetical protein
MLDLRHVTGQRQGRYSPAKRTGVRKNQRMQPRSQARQRVIRRTTEPHHAMHMGPCALSDAGQSNTCVLPSSTEHRF